MRCIYWKLTKYRLKNVASIFFGKILGCLGNRALALMWWGYLKSLQSFSFESISSVHFYMLTQQLSDKLQAARAELEMMGWRWES